MSKEVLESKKAKNKKLSPNQLHIINEFHSLNKTKTTKITQRQALIYLEKTHSIKISTTTYNKVIKGIY